MIYEKYIVYHQVESGVVKQVTVYATHKREAEKMFLEKYPSAKIIHIHLV